MSKVFKTASDASPKCISAYEHSELEEIIPEETFENPQEAREKILAEARQEAEKRVKEAYAEGYRRGMESGRADFDRAVADSAEALKSAARAIEEARGNFLAALEPEMVELAARIARQILHRETQVDRELIACTARMAIQHLMDRETIVIKINPADMDAMRAEKLRLVEEFDGITDMRLVADESIEPGGCIAESGSMQADASIDSQLQAILESLKQSNGRDGRRPAQ